MEAERADDGQGFDFVTLGMFILARLWSPPPLSASVGWVVDAGADFPPALATLIDSWATAAVVRRDGQRLTTRACNGYRGPAQRRVFRYLTPKKRITADDLPPHLLLARSFHLVCSPARCQELVARISALRSAAAACHLKPVFVWEPVPDLCTPDQLLNCTNTLPLVDVCSPNHAELAALMADDDAVDAHSGRVSTLAVERACEQLLASMPLQSYALVIRAADSGCYIARNGGTKRPRAPRSSTPHARGGLRPDTDVEALFAGLVRDADGLIARDDVDVDPGTDRWIPAYHQDPAKVDPIGAGNAFLGALTVALVRGHSLDDAALWGSVAASFAIEQVGMPLVATDRDGNETWDGDSVRRRLQEFQLRL